MRKPPSYKWTNEYYFDESKQPTNKEIMIMLHYISQNYKYYDWWYDTKLYQYISKHIIAPECNLTSSEYPPNHELAGRMNYLSARITFYIVVFCSAVAGNALWDVIKYIFLLFCF